MNAVPNISGEYLHSNFKKMRNVIQEGRLVKIIYEEFPICGYGELFCNQAALAAVVWVCVVSDIWYLIFCNEKNIWQLLF